MPISVSIRGSISIDDAVIDKRYPLSLPKSIYQPDNFGGNFDILEISFVKQVLLGSSVEYVFSRNLEMEKLFALRDDYTFIDDGSN